MTISQYKSAGRMLLRDNWVEAILAFLVVTLASTILSPTFLGFIFLVCPLYLGYEYAFRTRADRYAGDPAFPLNSTRSGLSYQRENLSSTGAPQNFGIFDSMFNATFNRYGHVLSVSVLKTLYIFLWSILLFIPGLIKSYSYMLSPYIALDYPDLSADECIHMSREMMYGNKWRFFVIRLSFLGWDILSLLTCGLALLYYQPFYQATKVAFYLDLRSRYAEVGPAKY